MPRRDEKVYSKSSKSIKDVICILECNGKIMTKQSRMENVCKPLFRLINYVKRFQTLRYDETENCCFHCLMTYVLLFNIKIIKLYVMTLMQFFTSLVNYFNWNLFSNFV